MVNSRAKGARGEYLVRDLLREKTGLQFERVPQSGALEYLKGDLYVPHSKNHYCIEVKFYAESPLSDKIFTQKKTNDLIRWWNKLVQQADSQNQQPLLFFKYNRSPVFVVTSNLNHVPEEHIYLSVIDAYVGLADEWLTEHEIDFTDD